MMKDMLGLAGVHTAKFDFCELGMETKGPSGAAMPARKRTTVMTNSSNIAEVLRQAAVASIATNAWREEKQKPVRCTQRSS